MAYTTIDNPELYFQSVLWTGNGSNPRTITFGGDENMQPDLLWYKCRSHAVPHILLDSVRGAGNDKELQPDDTTVEGGTSADADGYISAFTSNGFTLTEGSSGDHYTNEGSRTFVAWGWKESATAGFDIVSYTGNATDRTISHSLSAVPKVIIIKNRSTTNWWHTYHHKLGNNYEVYLNVTNVAGSTDAYQSTDPTSSVFSLDDSVDGTNGDGNSLIAYLFAPKQGYSAMGSYTGNGNADGPFIYTGFRPAMIIVKSATETRNWRLWDNKRSTFNLTDEILYPDLNNAEATGDSEIDMLSNGFKLKKNSDNTSGETYIYMAFAEAPFVNSNGVPCNAR